MMDQRACLPTETDEVLDHLPSLRVFALSLTGNQSDADEVLKETLSKAIAKNHSFRTGKRLRPWLMMTMRSVFQARTNNANRDTTGSDGNAATSHVISATGRGPGREKEVKLAMMSLPVHYREALVLVGILGLSHEDAAQICGVAVGTAKSRVKQARLLLQWQRDYDPAS
ncbi:RNA polymerase sigma-70 factor (ECF subfamily) [Roseovarius sp. MBR-154]|jgi:RNA polymerase sigma-70 factor (ECF subfamily)